LLRLGTISWVVADVQVVGEDAGVHAGALGEHAGDLGQGSLADVRLPEQCAQQRRGVRRRHRDALQ